MTFGDREDDDLWPRDRELDTGCRCRQMRGFVAKTPTHERENCKELISSIPLLLGN